MPRSSMNLKHVLVIPYVLLVLIAGLIAGIITWYYSSSISKELGTHIGEETSIRIKEQLDGYLNQANIANNYIKHSHDSNLLDISNQQQTVDFITSIIKANPTFSTLQVGYPNNEYVGIGNSPNGLLLKKIAGKATNHDFYVSVLPTGKTTKTKENFDVTKRSWYKEAITLDKKNQPVWSSVYIMTSSGKPGVTLSEALYNDANELIGVVGTDVVFNDLNQELYNIKVTDNSFLFIVDGEKDSNNIQDKIIATSTLQSNNKQALFDKDNELLQQASDFINENSSDTNKPFYNHQSLLINQGKSKDYFISYIPYKHDEGLNWYIGIVIPESDYLDGIYSIKNQTIGMWLVTFLLALLLGYLITHYINNNIKNLQRKLKKIENTGAMYEHEFYSIKEINGLSNTFSVMSRRLYESYIDLQRDRVLLEKLVDERTSDLEKVNLELQKKSFTDNLTELKNRDGMEHALTQSWHKLENGSIQHLTLMMCDLDFFKQYNDTYKHQQGDIALQTFAKIIQSSIKDTDIAIRYGGEEFLVILPDTYVDEAIKIAKAIQQGLADAKIPHKKSSISEFMTTSIGIASTNTEQMSTEYALINRADSALYIAKSKGRNCYIIYDFEKDKLNALEQTESNEQ